MATRMKYPPFFPISDLASQSVLQSRREPRRLRQSASQPLSRGDLRNHMAEFARPLDMQAGQVFEGNLDRGAQELRPAFPDLFLVLNSEILVSHDLNIKTIHRLLKNPEVLNSGNLSHRIDQRQRIDDAAVGSHDRIVCASFDPLKKRKRAPTTARAVGKNTYIARRIAYKRSFVRIEIGDYYLTCLPGRHGTTASIQYFHDYRVPHDVHAPLWAFMCNEAAVASTVAVGHRTVERFGDQLALMG